MAVAKNPRRVRLQTDFAGIKTGSMLFAGAPQEADQYIRKLPQDETRTVERMRRDLAWQNKCDATCPVSRAIVVRMAAEAASEDIGAGVPTSQVSPFRRALERDPRIAKKLPVDSTWTARQRAVELVHAGAVQPGCTAKRVANTTRP